MTAWLILTATLPSQPSALRVRVWRALKATGAGALREGVYLLPANAPTAQALWDMARLIQGNGADAHMLEVSARDDLQEKTFQALFDRSELYEELLLSIEATRQALQSTGIAELHKTLRALEQQLHTIESRDFFPGKSRDTTRLALLSLRTEVQRQLSPGEPVPRAEVIQHQAVAQFQGKTWATRQRPWVDRLASAWLIQRFIDASPHFIWLQDPPSCPATALGFDFDHANFTHVGDKVTFEVLAHTFSLSADKGIRRLGQLVHCVDVGGTPVDEAPGLELLVRGLHAQHTDDDDLLAAALPLFDTLYAALRQTP